MLPRATKRHSLAMMKCFLLAAFGACVVVPLRAAEGESKIRVLVVTGGHGFEKQPFFRVFEQNPQISFETVQQPQAQARFAAGPAKDWDVLVLYDLWQPLTEQVKADFLALLKVGKGIVSLHHSLADYQDWEAYGHIIGGKYFLAAGKVDGRDFPASTYKDDVHFKVEVAAKDHPVTRGVGDFEIVDENYGGLWVDPAATVLLRTAEPTNHPVLAWARQEQASRIVYLQLGHGPSAHDDPNFRRLVAQAIRWTAKRE